MSTVDELAPTAALTRRRQVLELSGWGLPFRLWQPHNLCFWLYVVFSVLGLLHLIEYFADGASVVAAGLGAGAAATAAYGLVFVAILRLGDHYERQPRSLALTAFIWGALPATFLFAIAANNAALEIYPKLFGQAFAADWGPALTAPFTEETSKAAGFVLLLGLAPRLVRTRMTASSSAPSSGWASSSSRMCCMTTTARSRASPTTRSARRWGPSGCAPPRGSSPTPSTARCSAVGWSSRSAPRPSLGGSVWASA